MSVKLFALLIGPVDTYSGYGSKTRDLFKAIIELKKDEWDIRIVATPWGICKFGFIDDNIEKYGILNKYIVDVPPVVKPDIFIQSSISSEFSAMGRYNIGFCSGIETTHLHESWIRGANNMDMMVVSSRHAAEGYLKTEYNTQNNITGELVNNLKFNKKIDVLFEGIDTDVYKMIKEENYPVKTEIDNVVSNIREEFVYLFVGHWLEGGIGEDRKNVGLLILSFLEQWKNKKKRPALLLKLSTDSNVSKDEVIFKINNIRKKVKGDLPSIYVFCGSVSDYEMNLLYNHPKIKAMVSMTKGEGYGRPLAEFSQSGKPIICTGFGGQVDFLKKETSILIGGQLRPIHPSCMGGQNSSFFTKEGQWLSVDITAWKRAIDDVYTHYNNLSKMALEQRKIVKEEFSYDKMKNKLNDILNGSPLPKEKVVEIPKLVRVKN